MEGEWRMRSHARGTEVEVTSSLELQSPSRLQPRVWLRMPWTSGGVTGSRRNEPAFLPHPPPPLPPSSSSTLQPPLSYIFGGLAPVCSPWAAAGPRAAGGLSGQKTADQAIQVVADPRPIHLPLPQAIQVVSDPRPTMMMICFSIMQLLHLRLPAPFVSVAHLRLQLGCPFGASHLSLAAQCCTPYTCSSFLCCIVSFPIHAASRWSCNCT